MIKKQKKYKHSLLKKMVDKIKKFNEKRAEFANKKFGKTEDA